MTRIHPILYYMYDDDENSRGNDYIKNNFQKRECNRFRFELEEHNKRICECGRSEEKHGKEALKNEPLESKPDTKTSRTDAFGKLELGKESDYRTRRNRWYVRLDHETDTSKILELFDRWEMWGSAKPDVILSIISTDKSMEKNPTTANNLTQYIRRMICSYLVTAAASINAWMITGGLNTGVDQFIGNEVKERLESKDKIPRAVLGISNWGCLDERAHLIKAHPNPPGFSLNPHHTHYLLVDDGTQMKQTGCQIKLREKIELAATKRKSADQKNDIGVPLIYILIGGSVQEFGFVRRALTNGIDVIVTLGSGGASEIIYAAITTKEGATLTQLPEIYSKWFDELKMLLISVNIHKTDIEDAIRNIKNIPFELFCEVIDLLDKIRISVKDSQAFKDTISHMKNIPTNDLLAEIKKYLTTLLTHASSNGKNDFSTVDRMRSVTKQLLVVNGIDRDEAIDTIDELHDNILKDMLDKVNRVFDDLNAIRNHKQKDLLLTFDVKHRSKRRITSFIVEALRKANWTQPSDVFMLAANWNHDISFRKLLKKRNWMPKAHEDVFIKLLQRKDYKYVQLMIENIADSNWLTKPNGPLEADFKKNELYKCLSKESNDPNGDTDYENERKRAKMLFIWCIQKKMPKAAMRFWIQGQDCLAMLLVAYKESRKEKKDLESQEGYQQVKDQMKYFQDLAVDFVEKCYANDKQNTQDLLIGKVKDLDGTTPLQIAVDVMLIAFLYVEPVKILLNKKWTKEIDFYGKNRNFLNKYGRLFASIACPYLAPALLDFEEPSDDIHVLQPIALVARDPEMVFSQMPSNDSNILAEDEEFQHFLDMKPVRMILRYFEYVSKVILFLNASLVICSQWFISYIEYIILFSIVLLTDFRARISPTEIALTSWTGILVIEEIRQALAASSTREYLKNTWNIVDIVALFIYLIGFVLRMIYHVDPTICPQCLYVARIVLAFSLIFFFIRTLQFLSIYEILGPKTYMIGELVVSDLIPLLVIMMVFVSAYGVVSNVILYPNQPLNAKLLRDVFHDAWWSVIQQFNLDDSLGSNCNKNNASAVITAEYCSSTSDDNIDYVRCKENHCPANNWIVSVLLAFYAILTCIMLLNVLIAMFNQTFDYVDGKRKYISALQRYRLIREFSLHTKFNPPLCVLFYPYNFVIFLSREVIPWLKSKLAKASNEKGESKTETETSSESQLHDLEQNLPSKVEFWESDMAEEYYKKNRKIKRWYNHRVKSETSDDEEDRIFEACIVQKSDNLVKKKRPIEEINTNPEL